VFCVADGCPVALPRSLLRCHCCCSFTAVGSGTALPVVVRYRYLVTALPFVLLFVLVVRSAVAVCYWVVSLVRCLLPCWFVRSIVVRFVDVVDLLLDLLLIYPSFVVRCSVVVVIRFVVVVPFHYAFSFSFRLRLLLLFVVYFVPVVVVRSRFALSGWLRLVWLLLVLVVVHLFVAAVLLPVTFIRSLHTLFITALFIVSMLVLPIYCTTPTVPAVPLLPRYLPIRVVGDATLLRTLLNVLFYALTFYIHIPLLLCDYI